MFGFGGKQTEKPRQCRLHSDDAAHVRMNILCFIQLQWTDIKHKSDYEKEYEQKRPYSEKYSVILPVVIHRAIDYTIIDISLYHPVADFNREVWMLMKKKVAIIMGSVSDLP
ncbi:MAG: hypothetical protein IJD60_02260, partial [Clostridia bacterium]|nr:hypothetical protein [Clostridia bacterium]